MSNYMRIESYSRPFDASDYKEKLKNGNRTLKGLGRSVNDREEIRRRLAFDTDNDELQQHFNRLSNGRKSSFGTRFHGGMLQLCFINETASDTIFQSKESSSLVSCPSMITDKSHNSYTHSEDKERRASDPVTSVKNPQQNLKRPSSLFTKPKVKRFDKLISLWSIPKPVCPQEFRMYHARLHTETRMALTEIKDIVKLQIQLEKLNAPSVTATLQMMNTTFLYSLSISQLQLLVNDLHSHIEKLNEELVRLLVERDDLHMEQDSILVDIEDLTMFL